jgi:hypothetical protein
MKIKGPADYPGPPAPPEPSKEGGRISSGQFENRMSESAAASVPKGKSSKTSMSFEPAFREVARAVRAEGLQGETAAARVVDRALEDVLGKEFMAGPQAAPMREAIGSLVTQDECLMGKIHSILSRLKDK